MKKSLLFAFFISIVFAFQSFCYAATPQYIDVKSSDWFYNNTIELSKKGIIDGYTDRSFRPYQLLQRDQLIKLLVVSQGVKLNNSPDYWAISYIQYAIDNKISSPDYPNEITTDFFAASVNRYETTKLALNLITSGEIPKNYSDYSNQIKDFESIPNKYKEIVLKGYALGLITGYPDGSFYGEKTLNRAEASTIIRRIISPSQRFVPMTSNKTKIINSITDRNSELFKDVISFSNLFTDFVIENNEYNYKGITGDFSFTSLELYPFQKSFCENIFAGWSNIGIIIEKAGFIETSLNSSAFSIAVAANQAQLLNSKNISIKVSDNGLISLYLSRSTSPSDPVVSPYLQEFANLIYPGNSELLIAEINSQYISAKQDNLYNKTIDFSPYTINVMNEESNIAFTFSFIKK